MALTDNLVAHYLLQNDANDETGNYNGTANGGIDFSGDVALFDGVDDFVESSLKITNNIVATYSFWINPSTSQNGSSIKQPFGYDSALNFAYDHNSSAYQGAAALRDDNGTWHSTGNQKISANTEHLITILVNDTTLDLYIDKVKVGSQISFSGYYYTAGNSLIIGSATNAHTSLFDGTISNFRVYSDIKDQAFIDDLYAEGYNPSQIKATGNFALTATATATEANPFLAIANGSFTLTATARPHRYTMASGSFILNGTALGFKYVPRGTGTFSLTATAHPKLSGNATFTLDATARAYASIPELQLFTFVQSIQQAQTELRFKFIQSIEQPKTATIIERVNT